MRPTRYSVDDLFSTTRWQHGQHHPGGWLVGIPTWPMLLDSAVGTHEIRTRRKMYLRTRCRPLIARLILLDVCYHSQPETKTFILNEGAGKQNDVPLVVLAFRASSSWACQ